MLFSHPMTDNFCLFQFMPVSHRMTFVTESLALQKVLRQNRAGSSEHRDQKLSRFKLMVGTGFKKYGGGYIKEVSSHERE